MISGVRAAAGLSILMTLTAAHEAAAFVRIVVPEAPDMSATVSLKGRAGIERFYGPPNYGETPDQDRQESATILDLEEDICVLPEDGSSCDGEDMQASVQMVISTSVEENIKAGECVVADGPLFRAFTGHHRRPVLMQVMTLHPCS